MTIKGKLAPPGILLLHNRSYIYIRLIYSMVLDQPTAGPEQEAKHPVGEQREARQAAGQQQGLTHPVSSQQ